MSDPELEAIRQQRRAQLQAQHQVTVPKLSYSHEFGNLRMW